jgi:hypothetical protein
MTEAAVVAGGAAFVYAGENGGAANGYDAVVEIFSDRSTKVLFDASEFHRRKKFSVGELRQTFGLAADAGELLDVVIPRGEISVTDGPVDGYSVFQIGFEIEIAPAIALTSPHEGLAADLAAANPGEVFARFAGVGVIDIVDKKLMGEFIAGVVALALDGLDALALRAIVPAAVLELPDGDVLDVVALRDDGAARFENQSVEAFFGEFFRGPAAGNARTDDDCVVSCSGHFFSVLSGVAETGAARHAAMLGSGNNFEFEFFGKTDFRGVVTVESDAFEDSKEIALELLVATSWLVT